MTTIEVSRIVCPVDFSETSQHALEHGAAWARWFGSGLTLLHVYGVPFVPPSVHGDPALVIDYGPRIRDHAVEELRRLAAPFESGGLPLELLAAEGDTVREILAHAGGLPADLLVMGTHGRGGFERWVLGSVTEKVVRKAPCPVLTVPARMEHRRAEGPVAYRTILCAFDFSSSSRRALDYALSLAHESRAQLVLAHVIEWDPDGAGRGAPPDRLAEDRARRMRDAQEQLRGAVPADARQWCQAQEVVAGGRPYREILRIAGETGADLIVIGCQGRRALDVALFGSTTQQVLRGALCPVLTVRA